jgi:4-hydroxy-tetrahydrodipicolinate synthase
MNTFSGLFVALATPFTPDFQVDMPAFRRLVRHVVEGGADGLLPLGSTGEAATLLEAERDAVVEACLEGANGLPVVVGTGSNSTRQAVAWTRRAQELGAQGALVVTPYYNKPTPSGLVAHYRAVTEAAPVLPVIIYNVPGRTGLNVVPSTLSRLWEIPGVMAIKESSGNLAQIAEMARTLPSGKSLLSGDDGLCLPAMAVGAMGLVSVLANLAPRMTKRLVTLALEGRRQEAYTHFHTLLPLMDALFLESNPIPLKAALALKGLCGDTLRLPLVAASPATRTALSALMTAEAEVG